MNLDDGSNQSKRCGLYLKMNRRESFVSDTRERYLQRNVECKIAIC